MLEALEEKFPADIAWKILSYCRHPIAELLDEPIAEWMHCKPDSYMGRLQFNHYMANKFLYTSLLVENPSLVWLLSESAILILAALPRTVLHPSDAKCEFITRTPNGIVMEFWRYRGSDGFLYSTRFILLSRPCRSKCVSN